MKKKTIAILMAAMLVCGGAAGATMAWLTAGSTSVVNTFTYGDINIELTEENPEDQVAKMVPGDDIVKDPKVTVKAESEPCYLFVKIEPDNDYEKFFGKFDSDNVEIETELSPGWMLLTGEDNVYYRIVNPNDGQPLSEDTSFYILKGNKVKVLETVKKEDMETLKKKGTDKYPTLKFTAYAVQLDNIVDAKTAWAQVSTIGSNTESIEESTTESPTETPLT